MMIADRDKAARELIRSEEHTSELQSLRHLVCRLLLEKKKQLKHNNTLPTDRDERDDSGIRPPRSNSLEPARQHAHPRPSRHPRNHARDQQASTEHRRP